MHIGQKKCKSTFVKQVISTLQNLILKHKKIFDSSFTRILFMKGSHHFFTDLLIASSLFNII